MTFHFGKGIGLWSLAVAAVFWGNGVRADDGSIAPAVSDDAAFVRVSPENPNYFELSNGSPYLAIGLNLCVLRELSEKDPRAITDEAKALAKMEFYFQKLAENGGNYARIWLASPFFETEWEKPGQYDEKIFRRIDQVLDKAQKYGVRLKLCFEHFRYISPDEPGAAPIFLKAIYKTDPPSTIRQWVNSEIGQQEFLNRCQAFADRYANHPAVFGWELWNEMNCLPDFIPWTEKMLPRLHQMFPNHLVFQSLGSFDNASYESFYRPVCLMTENDVAQVHRYLDPGARLEVCHGPMDLLLTDAVKTLRSYNPKKPILMTETGAVKSCHSGPSELYWIDKEGLLFHDALFAPFFAGAAGSGHIWHWADYVERNDLWYHLGRFHHAVQGINPVAERFEPFETTIGPCRAYGLRGQMTTLVWLRDAESNWKTELIDKTPAPTRSGLTVDPKALAPESQVSEILFYDPWTDRETILPVENGRAILPDFRRSGVLKIGGSR